MMADSKPVGAGKVLIAICCGALVALIVGYAACYVATHFGLGSVSASDSALAGGRSVFSRAALNLYAMQHITLVGRGTGIGAISGQIENVFATITLPLSLWALLPALALILGGYCAASVSGARSRAKMTWCAICAGVLYAVILAAAARGFHARIDSFLMPELSGFQSNPQDIPFRPSVKMAIRYAGIFGVFFAYLGALIAVRKHASGQPRGKWWACGKAVVVAALVLQLLIVATGVLMGQFSSQKKHDDATENRQMSVVELLPTAAGFGYGMIHGANLTAAMESYTYPTKQTSKLFNVRASLYSGITRDDMDQKSRRPISKGITAAAVVLGAVAALLMGRLAVRWGSRDGSLPTAFRVALIHTACLALMVSLTRSVLITMDPIYGNAIVINLDRGLWLAYSFAGVFVLSLIGATIGGRRRAALMES